jgi:hypothetical protein
MSKLVQPDSKLPKPRLNRHILAKWLNTQAGRLERGKVASVARALRRKAVDIKSRAKR